MGKVATSGKHNNNSSSSKRVKLVWILCGLLGAGLIADLLWASSSSSSSSLSLFQSTIASSSNGPPKQSDTYIVVPIPTIPQNNSAQGFSSKGKNGDHDAHVPQRVLSATFSDLPAPQLQWEKMATAPVPRLDGAAIQINNLLFVFAGYGTIDYVHSHVDIYNFTDNTWGGRFDMPKEMAHSHLGMATDGRYIYVVTGQYGPQCRGPTARTFVLDTVTKQWRDMPPLPVPRYAPATQLWRGRLHVMGGSKENRHTPGLEHWSLAVKDGKALEKEWRTEIPIPRGGPHRYYSEHWLHEDPKRVPPHRDEEVTLERNKCLKRFFDDTGERTQALLECAKFSTKTGAFQDIDSIQARWTMDPHSWWVIHGTFAPKLQELALKLLVQPASSSCCERNWSTYSFIHSVRRNKMAHQRADDLVFIHQNLRVLSRKSEEYKKGQTKMWDIAGDKFDSLEIDDIDMLEVADLSLDEPELEAVLFTSDIGEASRGDGNDDSVEVGSS